MNVFVDTSVWSLAFRRSPPEPSPAVDALRTCLTSSDTVLVTGLVVQELLQGVQGPRAREELVARMSRLPLLVPDLQDHIEAAALRNQCRKKGVQAGTIDALIARLCIRHRLRLLTTDQDFVHIAKHTALTLLAV